MTIFTSKRERWLWFDVLVVIAAIYSTLGIAGKLTASLRGQNLLNASFGVGFILIIVSIILSGWRKQSRRHEIWIGLGITAVYGMVMVRVFVTPEERTHLVEYGVVAALIYQALMERQQNNRSVPFPMLLAVIATAILGLIDEGIQGILPSRVYDIRDVGFNALAGLMAVVSIAVISWGRQRFEK